MEFEGRFIDIMEVFNVDKYEFNIKLEQIKKLAAKKEYKQAAEIAKQMNWNKVKDWSTLATIINVQEAAGDYEEARDMAILAYNRNLGGRKLIYKLTEFFIKVDDFENAEELYREYAKLSAHDVNKYILYYDLRRAQDAPDTELVDILEKYKEAEIDEKYMYELAELYYKTGRKEDCSKTCDNLVLWFQDGIYVEKAVKLKEKLGVTMTNTQKKILSEINARKSDEEANKERLFMEQKELARLKKDEVGDLLDEDDKADSDKAAPSNKASDSRYSNVTDKALRFKSEDVAGEQPVGNIDYTGNDRSTGNVNVAGSSDVAGVKDTSGLSMDLVQNDQSSALKESIVNALRRQEAEGNSADESVAKLEKEQDNRILDENADKKLNENVSKASMSLKELIENAKRNIENSCDKITKEDEEEAREAARKRIDEKADAMDIEVKVPNYNLYDTHNIQEELAKNINDIFSDEESFKPPFERKTGMSEALNESPAKTSELRTDGTADSNAGNANTVYADGEAENIEDEQIEGQLSIADWMETVREEKYGKQDTREFSKVELERMLDEKDEKSEAYEKIVAMKKEEALRKGTEFSEREAKRLADAEVLLGAAKRDLAMRTGKASFILDQKMTQELERAREALKVAEDVNNSEAVSGSTGVNNGEAVSGNTVANNVEAVSGNVIANNSEQAQDDSEWQRPEVSDTVNEKAAEPENEELTLNTTHFEPVTDEVLNNYNNVNNSEAEYSRAAEPEIAATDFVTPGMNMKFNVSSMDNEDDNDRVWHNDKKLSGELAKIFKKYREMPGLEEQLVDLFESLDEEMAMTNSSCGNILISGNSSSDKTDLARTIVRAINYVYPDRPKKIAKTSGESINQRGITKAMGKLKGTALIVEGAGTIQPKRINEIISCLNEDTDRMVVIFEDSDAEMNVLVNFNPDMVKTFNHRITLKQYTVNELVDMAKRFARKRQYEVDDDALLELYLKIDKLHSVNDNIKLDDIKEIINRAIANSEKRASRKFFGGLKKKRSERGDVIFLTEADFKD